MTLEQAKQTVEALQAWIDGRPIQYFGKPLDGSPGLWVDCLDFNWVEELDYIRAKPNEN